MSEPRPVTNQLSFRSGPQDLTSLQDSRTRKDNKGCEFGCNFSCLRSHGNPFWIRDQSDTFSSLRKTHRTTHHLQDSRVTRKRTTSDTLQLFFGFTSSCLRSHDGALVAPPLHVAHKHGSPKWERECLRARSFRRESTQGESIHTETPDTNSPQLCGPQGGAG